MIDPAGGVFFGNSFADRKFCSAKLIGHKRPAHGDHDFVILEKICKLPAGGPELANIGLKREQFVLHRVEFLIAQVVKMAGFGLVIPENLCGHVDRREIVPNGNLVLEFGVPKRSPSFGSFGKCTGVVNKRVWSPHKRHAVDIVVAFYQRHVA